MTKTKCKHVATTAGTDRAYKSGVAHIGGRGGTENRAAHGNIEYTETCSSCGFERLVLQNQLAVERSAWYDPRVTPTLADRQRATDEMLARRQTDFMAAAPRLG